MRDLCLATLVLIAVIAGGLIWKTLRGFAAEMVGGFTR